jgi:hypothetical protein
VLANVFTSINNALKLGKLSKGASQATCIIINRLTTRHPLTFVASNGKQLGGEFVFGPNKEVLYTHRMEVSLLCAGRDVLAKLICLLPRRTLEVTPKSRICSQPLESHTRAFDSLPPRLS